MPNRAARFETAHCRSSDGTALGYWRAGRPAGPSLILVEGLSLQALWQPLVAYLGHRMRIVGWDLRGLGRSAQPGGERPADHGYAMAQQLADLDAIMTREGIQEAAVLGHGIGVPIAVEAARALPLRALVAVCGTAGRLLDGLPWWQRSAMRAALDSQLWFERARRGLTRGWLAQRLFRQRLAALAGDGVDPGLTAALAAAIGTADGRALRATLRMLCEHDAFVELSTLSLPALVLAGRDDPLVSPALAQQMARELPNSEVLVLRGGRHMLPAQLPDLFNLRLERFLEDVGLL